MRNTAALGGAIARSRLHGVSALGLVAASLFVPSPWGELMAQSPGAGNPVAPADVPAPGNAGASNLGETALRSAPEADSQDDGAQIIVTGSRVVRDGFQAPTPVRVLSAEQLAASAPSSLADALTLTPEFQNSLQPRNTGISSVGNAGQSFLNLRSLGEERTLILLDGRRVVPSTGSGTVDISILPDALVRRVEVVTGGASAAYGSDAISGVVNFILDTDFTGLRATGQYGVSDRGDAENKRFSVAGGTPLFGGRGHVLATINYYENEGIATFTSRDWFRSCSRIPNPAGSPGNIVACGVNSAHFTEGGLITSGPLAGTEFGPGGQAVPFIYGDLRTNLSMVGGSGVDHAALFQPLPGVERTSGFARFSYDVADDITLFVEGLGAEAKADYDSTYTWQGLGTAYTIYQDNGFLPNSVREAMIFQDIESFPLSRYNYDFGPLYIQSRNRTWRVVAGLDARLGDWTVNTYYEHGENKYHQTVENNLQINRLYNAVDAVTDPATGRVICRSTLTFPDNGCVPLNLFGNGSPSHAALDWIQGTTVQDVDVRQDVVEFSVSGEPMAIGGRGVSVAVGMGYRREASTQTSDPISQSLRHFTGGYRGFPASAAFEGQIGGWERTNPLPATGSYNVQEIFGEVLVPLFAGQPFAAALDLNGAVRYTDYSTSGGVTTWKLGATYRPIEDILLRVSRSRDIRAPNINELYRGSVQGQSNITDHAFPVGDPRNRPFVLGSNYGNPDLRPEKADTFTVGGIYEPSFVPWLAFSVDYYNIKIEDAIATLGGQTTVDQCFAGTTGLCANIIRDEDGVIVQTLSPSLNVAARRTSGLDFEARYVVPITGLGGALDGDLTFRLIANRIFELTTETPGASPIDTAGQLGSAGGAPGSTGSVPDWSGNLTVRYDAESWSVFVQERFIKGGLLDRTLDATALAPEQNRVSNVWYTNATFNYRFELGQAAMEAFLTINNLFDRDPPLAPGAFFVFGTSHTNSGIYDTTGRTYTSGLRVRF